MFSSSRISLARASWSLSPFSTLPPGNSHLPIKEPYPLWAHKTSPDSLTMAAPTTWITGFSIGVMPPATICFISYSVNLLIDARCIIGNLITLRMLPSVSFSSAKNGWSTNSTIPKYVYSVGLNLTKRWMSLPFSLASRINSISSNLEEDKKIFTNKLWFSFLIIGVINSDL